MATANTTNTIIEKHYVHYYYYGFLKKKRTYIRIIKH